MRTSLLCCSINHRPKQYWDGQRSMAAGLEKGARLLSMAAGLEAGARILIAWPASCEALRSKK